jgi:hypothetical protein
MGIQGESGNRNEGGTILLPCRTGAARYHDLALLVLNDERHPSLVLLVFL